MKSKRFRVMALVLVVLFVLGSLGSTLYVIANSKRAPIADTTLAGNYGIVEIKNNYWAICSFNGDLVELHGGIESIGEDGRYIFFTRKEKDSLQYGLMDSQSGNTLFRDTYEDYELIIEKLKLNVPQLLSPKDYYESKNHGVSASIPK